MNTLNGMGLYTGPSPKPKAERSGRLRGGSRDTRKMRCLETASGEYKLMNGLRLM